MNLILKEYFEPIAKKYNLTIAQLSVAALVSQDGVVALCGARNPKQVEENFKAGELLIEKEDIGKLMKAIATLNMDTRKEFYPDFLREHFNLQ